MDLVTWDKGTFGMGYRTRRSMAKMQLRTAESIAAIAISHDRCALQRGIAARLN